MLGRRNREDIERTGNTEVKAHRKNDENKGRQKWFFKIPKGPGH